MTRKNNGLKKIYTPEWFASLKLCKKYIKFIMNLTPDTKYFERLLKPYVGIVVNDSMRYAYIVEFQNNSFDSLKDAENLDFGEYVAVKFNNQDKKLIEELSKPPDRKE